MQITQSKNAGWVTMPIKAVPFRRLVDALGCLPSAKIVDATRYWTDEDFVAFDYKGLRFEVHTGLAEYQLDKPANCPSKIFHEIVGYLANCPARRSWFG
jgi:hypothetical protein